MPMTKKQFQQLATDLGAELVFQTSASAVFHGSRFTVTVSMDDSQLAHANPTEVAHLMSTTDMLN